jgi:ATP-binding cassette subfamily B (MDR/TAP) protein 1
MQQDNIKTKNIKAVSFFKLQFFETNISQKIIIFIAIIGSLASGLSMPLFAILLGRTINNLGALMTGQESMINTITELSKIFVYVGLGIAVASFTMVWLWMYIGQLIVKRIKEEYFRKIMMQEQGWFDSSNPYEFTTKIKSQTHSIEIGVILIKAAW